MRRPRISSPAFTPTQLSGLALWLDAGQLTGVADGGSVATWQDVSGNAKNATQATGSKQPIYRTTGVHLTPAGRPVVQFDGVDDTLTSLATAVTTAGTVILCRKFVAVTTNAYIYTTSSANNGFAETTNGTSARSPVYKGVVAFGDGAATTAHEVTAIATNTSTNPPLYTVNGSAQTLTGSGAMSAGNGAFMLGQNFDLNGAASLALAELIAYSRVLTTTERQQVEAYLKSKHGTP